MIEYVSISNLIKYGLTVCNSQWSVYEKHSRFHRLYFVISGEAYYISGTERLKLKANTLYIFPINKKYAIEHNPDNPLFCMWFHLFFTSIITSNIVEVSLQNAPELTKLIDVLKLLIQTDKMEYSIAACTNSLIVILDEAFRPFNIAKDKRLQKIIDYIHQNFKKKDLDNTELSKLENLDVRYFIRIFKRYMGQTPYAYLSNYRIFQAIQMLSDGSSVAETAENVGYADVKAFSRFFKLHYGVAPSKFNKGYFLQP